MTDDEVIDWQERDFTCPYCLSNLLDYVQTGPPPGLEDVVGVMAIFQQLSWVPGHGGFRRWGLCRPTFRTVPRCEAMSTVGASPLSLMLWRMQKPKGTRALA